VLAAGCRELCANPLGPSRARVDKRERETRDVRKKRKKR
jgi:hypothetical protein